MRSVLAGASGTVDMVDAWTLRASVNGEMWCTWALVTVQVRLSEMLSRSSPPAKGQ